MANNSALSRRLSLIPPTIAGEPMPSFGGAVIASTQNPAAGSPVTQVPPAAPGMLPQTSVAPLYDPAAAVHVAAPQGDGAGSGWQGALQRALIGFSKGASRVQVDPTYNPVGAGLVGGAETVGADVADTVNRKLAAQAAALQPFKDAQAAALKKSYEDVASVPEKQREQQDILNREVASAKAKAELGNTPEEIETTARNLVNVPPSMWSQLLGRTSHSRAAIFNRVAELQGKSPQQIQASYQIGLSGGIAGAAFNASGKGQQTARAANQVKLLLPGLQKASDDFARSNLPLANAAISSFDVQTGGDKALALKQYMTDTKVKMSTALMQGGVPTDEAINLVNNAFPDGLSASQMGEAIKNISAIMDTQIQGGLSPITLNPPAKAAPASPAPAAAGPQSTFRKY